MLNQLDTLDRRFGDEPPHRGVDPLIRAGRARRRRRRVTSGLAGGAALTVAAAGAWGATSGGHGAPREAFDHAAPAQQSPAATQGTPSAPADAFLAACYAGADAGQRQALFGPGDPRVVGKTTFSAGTAALVVAADDSTYGVCVSGRQTRVALAQQDYQSALGTEVSWSMEPLPTCPGGGLDCQHYEIAMAGKRSAEAAAMDVTMLGGETTRVETPDGYFLLIARGTLPEGWTWKSDAPGDVAVAPDGSPHPLLERLRLFDAGGSVIAQGGTWLTAADRAAHPNPPGVPSMNAYPEQSQVQVHAALY